MRTVYEIFGEGRKTHQTYQSIIYDENKKKATGISCFWESKIRNINNKILWLQTPKVPSSNSNWLCSNFQAKLCCSCIESPISNLSFISVFET